MKKSTRIHPPKLRILHFGCEKNGVEIRTKVGDKYKSLGIAADIDGMRDLIEKINLNDDTDICMFSSSMDFPDEYTNEKNVLELCKKLRG